MQPAVLIRLRPSGPWRYGPGDGGRDRLDTLYRSDRFFSAVTIAMKQLGFLEEWLGATTGSPEPAVTFTSLFPFQGETLFVAPPATLWPPVAGLVTAPSATFLAKIRWSAAQFVPAALVESLLLGQKILADQWTPDPQSRCLLRRDRPNTSPFYSVVRRGAAVDRISQSAAEVHTSACIEFQPGSGFWTAGRYQDDNAQAVWGVRVKAALRLLADTGFGGRRSSGWGATEAPEFQDGGWPGLLFPKLARWRARAAEEASADGQNGSLYWLLSLYSPAPTDGVDWSSGNYQATVRGGHVDGAVTDGLKKRTRMITEGSVLSARVEPVGAAVDVAPDGFPHPVYRSGFAVSLKLPTVEIGAELATVETPTDPEAIEPPPCEAVEAAALEESMAEPQKLEDDVPDADAPQQSQDIEAADSRPEDVEADGFEREAAEPAEVLVEDGPESAQEPALSHEVDPESAHSESSFERESEPTAVEPSSEVEPQSSGPAEGSVEDPRGGSEETEREL